MPTQENEVTPVIGQVYRMIPSSATALWVMGAFAVLMMVLAGLFGYIALSSRQVRFEVSEMGVKITGPYGRLIPAEVLRVDQARALDLTESHEYRPQWRISGIGLPGYGAGWFRLRNGERALVYLTDRTHVAYVPTTEGYSLLLSVAQLDRFLGSLSNAMVAR